MCVWGGGGGVRETNGPTELTKRERKEKETESTQPQRKGGGGGGEAREKESGVERGVDWKGSEGKVVERSREGETSAMGKSITDSRLSFSESLQNPRRIRSPCFCGLTKILRKMCDRENE